MKTSPVTQVLLLLTMAAVIASSVITVAQTGWSAWTVAALACAAAVAIAITVQSIRAARKR